MSRAFELLSQMEQAAEGLDLTAPLAVATLLEVRAPLLAQLGECDLAAHEPAEREQLKQRLAAVVQADGQLVETLGAEMSKIQGALQRANTGRRVMRGYLGAATHKPAGMQRIA